MIERVHISCKGKNQLVQLKRKTGIDQYNILCRFALVLSMEEGSIPPEEDTVMANGLEIDWGVFCSGQTEVYTDLLICRCKQDGLTITDENLKRTLFIHLHRGLDYLMAKPEKIYE